MRANVSASVHAHLASKQQQMTDDDSFERNPTFPAFPPGWFHPGSGFPQMLSAASLPRLSIMQTRSRLPWLIIQTDEYG